MPAEHPSASFSGDTYRELKLAVSLAFLALNNTRKLRFVNPRKPRGPRSVVRTRFQIVINARDESVIKYGRIHPPPFYAWHFRSI